MLPPTLLILPFIEAPAACQGLGENVLIVSRGGRSNRTLELVKLLS